MSRDDFVARIGCLGKRELLLDLASTVASFVVFLFGGWAELIDNAHVGQKSKGNGQHTDHQCYHDTVQYNHETKLVPQLGRC